MKQKEALLEKERKSKEKGKTNKRERRKKISFVGLWTIKDEVLAGLGNLVTKRQGKVP